MIRTELHPPAGPAPTRCTPPRAAKRTCSTTQTTTDPPWRSPSGCAVAPLALAPAASALPQRIARAVALAQPSHGTALLRPRHPCTCPTSRTTTTTTTTRRHTRRRVRHQPRRSLLLRLLHQGGQRLHPQHVQSGHLLVPQLATRGLLVRLSPRQHPNPNPNQAPSLATRSSSSSPTASSI